ncbi:MAG: phosphate ABC transporter permease subunit PstC [Candidatus Lokiarchaeota archaeon]|nr:phosphate ABC transporter permease subunit PstC [Candidatus Lokiarchaeota archaeon]
MTFDEKDQAYEIDSEMEADVGIFARLRVGIQNWIDDIRYAKGPARKDLLGRFILFIPAVASIFTILMILLLLVYEATPIFAHPDGGLGIIFDSTWAPQLPDNPSYGILIFIVGSFTTTFLAIGIAVPLGLGGAIFLSEFCPAQIRTPLKMIVEMMAAIPSIVYGLWAFVVLRPFMDDAFAPFVQTNPLTSWMPWFQGSLKNGYSLLTGGVILAIMLLPTVVTVSYDALQSVPGTYREASFALGATKSETAKQIVLSAALPGVGAAVVLSLGRAVGETMAILMVTGNNFGIPFTLFDQCYVMTSIIANQMGAAYNRPIWRSALFSVALVLMIMSVIFTLIAKLFIRWGLKTRGMS